MAPTGSTRKVRYQLRGLRLHDRMNRRLSTTTIHTPMTRCGSDPARMPRILPLCSSPMTSSGKRLLAAGGFLGMRGSPLFSHSLPLASRTFVAPLQLRRKRIVRSPRTEDPPDSDSQHQHRRNEDEMGGALVLHGSAPKLTFQRLELLLHRGLSPPNTDNVNEHGEPNQAVGDEHERHSRQ